MNPYNAILNALSDYDKKYVHCPGSRLFFLLFGPLGRLGACEASEAAEAFNWTFFFFVQSSRLYWMRGGRYLLFRDFMFYLLFLPAIFYQIFYLCIEFVKHVAVGIVP